MHVRGVAVGEGAASRGEHRVPDPPRAVRLGRRDERPYERRLASEGHLHVVAAGQLQHGAGVLGDLAGVDVAADAGDGDELRLR